MANDLAKLLNRDQLVYYADKIDEELQLEERSYLISQTLNSQSGLNYDQVRHGKSFQKCFALLQKKGIYNDRYKLL